VRGPVRFGVSIRDWNDIRYRCCDSLLRRSGKCYVTYFLRRLIFVPACPCDGAQGIRWRNSTHLPGFLIGFRQCDWRFNILFVTDNNLKCLTFCCEFSDSVAESCVRRSTGCRCMKKMHRRWFGWRPWSPPRLPQVRCTDVHATPSTAARRLSLSNVWAVSCWNHNIWITYNDTSSSCPDKTFPGRCNAFRPIGVYTHVWSNMLIILKPDGAILDVEHTNTHRIRFVCQRYFVMKETNVFFFFFCRNSQNYIRLWRLSGNTHAFRK